MTTPISADRTDPAGMPPHIAQAAAQALDLRHARRIVYVGGDGQALAAFLDHWHHLEGIWFGPAEAGPAAGEFLAQRRLQGRIRHEAGTALTDTVAGDLVVFSLVDAAVDLNLRLLASAGPGWLPASGRWVILQRQAPHLSSIAGPPLLADLGLRVASQWPLGDGIRMLVCAPAHRFVEALARRHDPLPAWRPS